MWFLRLSYIVLLLMGLSLIAPTISAQETSALTDVKGRYASIIIDSDTLEIFHARKIDEARYPASLTKVMTLYLTFDALSRGQLQIDQKLTVSPYAASQPPSKLGLKAGQSLIVRDAINALIIRSANDAAVVLAEAIGGSERNFARLMTVRARELGMKRTVFQNPHGLPNDGHVSTARDMAKLANAMIRDHRTYYPLFSQRQFNYRGRTIKSTNSLLGTTDGVDGLKTGYTFASGYNLTISAERQGRRLVAVVMGGASGKSRDQHMRDLIEKGFEVILKQPAPPAQRVIVKREPIPQRKSVQQASTAILKLRGANGQTQTVVKGQSKLRRPEKTQWSLHLKDFRGPHDAQDYLLALTEKAPNLRDHIEISEINRQFQARFTGLPHKDAAPLCQHIKSQGQSCLMIQQTAVR